MRNTSHLSRAALCGLLLTTTAVGAGAATLTVPAQYPTIQGAISAAQPGDTVVIADGTYTGPGNVNLDFGGKAITVTSQNGPASTIIDGQGATYDVRFHSGETANARLQGLTLQGGLSSASNGQQQIISGGGVQIINGSTPTLVGCTFTRNLALGFGGGVYADATANPTVLDCAFVSNQFGPGKGTSNSVSGAGMYVGGGATITRCAFVGNVASSKGGALYLNGGSALVTACTFTGNSSFNGGAVFCNTPGSVFLDCAFTGNSATGDGGGLEGASLVTNCTFTANTAAAGGGVFAAGMVTNCTFTGNSAPSGAALANTLTVLNSILYGDGGPEVGGSPTVTYSDVQGGFPGTGDFSADPLFVNPPADLHLRPGSPALFAGTPGGAPATDLSGHARPNPPSLGALEPVPAALPDIADSSVLSSAPAQNFGSSPTLTIGGFLGAAYLKFDLGTLGLLGPNSTVRLHLNAGLAQKGTASLVVSATGLNWTEPGLTFLNRPAPALPLGFLNVSANGQTSAPYDVDITGYVKAQQASGATQLALVLSQYQFGLPVSLDSKENPAQGAPQLLVTY